MESVQKLIEWMLGIGVNWPDVSSIFLGTLSGWSIATITEFLLSGTIIEPLTAKKVTVVLTVIASWFCAALMWHTMDPIDPIKTIIIECGVLAPISPMTYAIVAKVASNYIPWINSLWSPEAPK